MSRFLLYTNTDDTEEAVNVDEIQCFLAGDEEDGQPTTEIYLRSDPDSSLTARGTPAQVRGGRIIDL